MPGGDGPGTPAYDFAAALGFEVVHREDHLVLDLPVAAEAIEALRARALADATAYEVLTWQGRCPDEHVEAYAAMRTRMDNDVPIGEIDHEPVVIDVERVRAGEQRTGEVVPRHHRGGPARRTTVSSAATPSCTCPHGADYVHQDDTLVMPEHRGHRLGTLLKCATLEIAQREHPERVAIHTDTAAGQPRDAGDQPPLRLPPRRAAVGDAAPRWLRSGPTSGRLPGRGTPVSPVWATDAFADEMRAWCSEVLDRDVRLEVQKIRGWSAVWRVTDGGEVWFAKQNCPGQHFEAAAPARAVAAVGPGGPRDGRRRDPWVPAHARPGPRARGHRR